LWLTLGRITAQPPAPTPPDRAITEPVPPAPAPPDEDQTENTGQTDTLPPDDTTQPEVPNTGIS
ncbi:MAG: hypothetical protein M3120_10550, partial [Pseudomonadota bacterium]|nr:hypothetical protein [Pseudomonadota bacterium]